MSKDFIIVTLLIFVFGLSLVIFMTRAVLADPELAIKFLNDDKMMSGLAAIPIGGVVWGVICIVVNRGNKNKAE